jgi:hypothetical protein
MKTKLFTIAGGNPRTFLAAVLKGKYTEEGEAGGVPLG